MANINLFPKKSPDPAEVDNHFILALDGSSDPTIVESNGLASVTHSGTGQYTLTFRNKYVAMKSANFTFECDLAEDLVPQIRSRSLSAKTIVIELCAAAVATDPPAKSSHPSFIHGAVTWRNSTAKGR